MTYTNNNNNCQKGKLYVANPCKLFHVEQWRKMRAESETEGVFEVKLRRNIFDMLEKYGVENVVLAPVDGDGDYTFFMGSNPGEGVSVITDVAMFVFFEIYGNVVNENIPGTFLTEIDDNSLRFLTEECKYISGFTFEKDCERVFYEVKKIDWKTINKFIDECMYF